MTSVSDGRCTRFGNPPAQGGQKDRIGSDRCVDCSLDRNVERTRLPAENCRHGGGCQAAERPARALRHFFRRQITVCGIIDGSVSAQGTNDLEGIYRGCRHGTLSGAAQQSLDQEQTRDQQRDSAGRHPISQDATHGPHALLHATAARCCHCDRSAVAADCLLFPKALGFHTIRHSMDERHGFQRQTHPPHHFRRDRGL
jgi:hypothetical protein